MEFPLKKKNRLKNAKTQWAKRDTLMSRGKNCRETIIVSQLSRSYPHPAVLKTLRVVNHYRDSY